ncbi:hypothetical protein CTZ27_07140 [Streptomyces griseocarneus]|nr:hypothetical protein CTZ27_07140 [Streptomyces griseocarneus]
MSQQRESVLRDQLAGNLALIEPGLSLIDTEFHLRNPQGARGYVDILARDSLGKVVIIELKRSESTARQAIHELFKYATLIRSEHGLGIEQIRCLLLSTAWVELLVPFSDFVRNVEYSVEGKRLTLDSKGNISGAEPVSLVKDPTDARLLPWHHAYLYENRNDRDSDALRLTNNLRSEGAPDHALALLNHDKINSVAIHPSAIYVAISMPFSKSHPLAAYEEYDSLTYRAGKQIRPSSIEIGYPDKLRQILRSWGVEQLIRSGRFTSDTLWPDDGLLSLMLSEDGQFSAWLNATASPRHMPSWKKFRANTLEFLEGNHRWRCALDWILEKAQEDETATVSLEIFNPRDIIAAVSRAVRHQDTRAFPDMEIIIDAEIGVSKFIGRACWDGVTSPADPNSTIGDLLPGGLEAYFGLYHFDEIKTYDPKLMERHGFSYELFEVSDGVPSRRLDPSTLTWMQFDEPDRKRFRSTAHFLLSNKTYAQELEVLTHPAYES